MLLVEANIGDAVDNPELYLRVRELESELFRSGMDTRDRIFKIWFVMLVGFEIIALCGLCLIHVAYVESVQETRREIASLQLKVPPLQVKRVQSRIVR